VPQASDSLTPTSKRPIGLLDSGLGGLTILREIRRHLPAEDVVYVADQAHVPYGPRSLEQVRTYSAAITRFLLEMGAKIVVVACNTASAAALRHLREVFPQVPFVGMEPAVKPAAETTRTRRVGVLATPATFQGELFASVVERFAGGVRVFEQTLPGLVERIESGDLDGPQTLAILQTAIAPLLARGVDTLVLACTHYPFVIPQIAAVAGPGVRVIDPSPAVARQAQRVVEERGLAAPAGRAGEVMYVSSGDALQLAAMAQRLIAISGEARQAKWEGGTMRLV
jgi:glutamate racemase